MLNVPRQGSLVLSRGAVLDTTWPAIKDPFPLGATTSIEFLDSDGNTITTIAGTAEKRRLVYLITDTEQLDSVPNGAQYELWVTTADGPYKLEYGVIIRREASFFTPAATSLEQESRFYRDLLNRDAVGRRWVATAGGVTMFPLGGDPPAYAMGPNIGLLFNQTGIRYFRPLGSDSFRIAFRVYDVDLGIGPGGSGKMRVHAGCDVALTSGMSFELFTATLSGDSMQTGLVTSPTDITYTDTPVADEVDNNDVFTIIYSDISKVFEVWRNNETSPMISWDTPVDLPHGPGYRYWGFSWDSSLAATGPMLLDVEAQDYV